MESVIEIYSASSDRWNVAHVVWIAKSTAGPEVLTLQFYQEDGPKNKSLYRNDHQLAPYGTHCGGEKPPGCQVVSSQSRPGQFSYLDSSGMKYETLEQVWKKYFERAGKNVLSVFPGCSPEAAAAASVAAPSASFNNANKLQPTQSFAAEAPRPELAAAFNQMLPHMQAHMGSTAANNAVNAAVNAPRDPRAGGKIALPGFSAPATGGVRAQQNQDSDELLITDGLRLAAQLMGGQGAKCGMSPAMNGGTIRRFGMAN
jgi:hypothetical protein